MEGIGHWHENVENVEFPISNQEIPAQSYVTKPAGLKYESYLMIYLVEEFEELRADGSTSAAGTEVQHSTTGVFETLPYDMVEEVVLRLPAAAQARSRAVCQDWLTMITNPTFSRRSFHHSLSQTAPPALCAIRHCFEYMEEPEHVRRIQSRYKSLKVDFSFLPKRFHSPESFHFSSECGLTCITCLGDEGMHVCILNPLNQSFKVLPVLQNFRGSNVLVLMQTVTTATTDLDLSFPSFKVCVSGVMLWPPPKIPDVTRHPVFNTDVCIYSSVSNEWMGFKGRPLREARESQPWAYNGEVYTTVAVRTVAAPRRLVRLSTVPGPRYLGGLPLPDVGKPQLGISDSDDEFLTGHRGRLLYCRRGIWMLDHGSQRWVKIAGRCPPRILLPPGCRNPILALEEVHVSGDLVIFVYTDMFRTLFSVVAYDMLGRF